MQLKDLVGFAGWVWGGLLAAQTGFCQALPSASAAVAPTAMPASKPAKRTLYFDARGRQVAATDSVDHREELIFRDSVGGMVRIYYPSGKLRRIEPYLHFDQDIRHGVESGFYETGEIKSRYEYRFGKQVGEGIRYYRSGAVRSRIKYADGVQKPQVEYFTMAGAPRPAPDSTKDQMPVLRKGGNAEIVSYIMRHVVYPTEALRREIKGRVFVSFIVDEAGFIRHVHVVKSPSPMLNEAAMRAVASLGRLKPGMQEGEPVDVGFTVPITFAIE
jgi:protein TonB